MTIAALTGARIFDGERWHEASAVLVGVSTAPATGGRRMPMHWLLRKLESITWWL